MPVLELTILRTPPSTTLPDREAITKALRDVRTLLAEKVHPTNSKFYIPVEREESEREREVMGEEEGIKGLDVYILGSWPSVPAHVNFLKNDKLRDKVLSAQEGILEWISGSHYALPGGATLPLDAPVLVMAFFDYPTTAVGQETSAQKLGSLHLLSKFQRLPASRWAQATLPLLDDGSGNPAEGTKGRKLVVSGWENVAGFREWLRGEGEEIGVGNGEGFEVVVLRDLEGVLEGEFGARSLELEGR